MDPTLVELVSGQMDLLLTVNGDLVLLLQDLAGRLARIETAVLFMAGLTAFGVLVGRLRR